MESYVRAHYGPEAVCVEANRFTLTDGTEIFPTRLYAELSVSPEVDWLNIIEQWLLMLDLVRARIAGTG